MKKNIGLIIGIILVGIFAVIMIYYAKNIMPGKEFDKKLGYNVDKYITLCDYKGLDGELDKVEITDEDVDDYINDLLVSYEEVDRKAKEGDYLSVNFTGYVDGEVDNDISDSEWDMCIGQYDIFEEFDDAMVGAKTGDTVTVECDTVSEWYGEEYEDITVTYEVYVNSVSEEVYGELTDDWVYENYGYDTVDEFREEVYNSLYDYDYEDALYNMQYSLFEKVVENSEMNGYPDELYEEKAAEINAENEYYAEMYGVDVDEYLEECGYTENDLKEEIELLIKEELVIQAIMKAEKIEVTEEDYQAELEEYEDYIADYGYDTMEEFEADNEEMIREEVKMGKILSVLSENAKITEVETTEDDDEYYDEDGEYYFE
ncbi:MAG: FKBP-type peptidyl-prolyl cis-trans isomerase [Eubacterium sp.]